MLNLFSQKLPHYQQNYLFFFDFESTFIKAGDSEAGRAQDRSNRGGPRQGCVDSLRDKSHSERSEPRWGCQLTGKSEKGGPWDRFRG